MILRIARLLGYLTARLGIKLQVPEKNWDYVWDKSEDGIKLED